MTSAYMAIVYTDSHTRKGVAYMTFEERLRVAIDEGPWDTDRSFAVWADLNPSQVSRWLTGARRPDFESIRKLADALGVTAGWLVAGEYPRRPSDASEDALRIEAVRQALNAPREMLAALPPDVVRRAREARGNSRDGQQ